MSLNQYVQEIEQAIAGEADAERRGTLVAYKHHVELALEPLNAPLQTELAI